jgi:hypothetical protein
MMVVPKVISRQTDTGSAYLYKSSWCRVDASITGRAGISRLLAPVRSTSSYPCRWPIAFHRTTPADMEGRAVGRRATILTPPAPRLARGRSGTSEATVFAETAEVPASSGFEEKGLSSPNTWHTYCSPWRRGPIPSSRRPTPQPTVRVIQRDKTSPHFRPRQRLAGGIIGLW